MIKVLHEVEQKLPELLREISLWNSVDITYHPPRVERLWRQYGDSRIYLHCIHPCTTEEALLHPHPWPSAMRIVKGIYEMGIGYAKGMDTPPPIPATVFLHPPSEYEMTDPNGWHYVRPINGCVYTLMVTSTPWKRESPKSTEPLVALPEKRKKEIINIFLNRYD
jgi:hypothetical protein